MTVILIVFAVSTVLSLCAVSLVLKLSHRKEWYDHIDERKIHSGNVPRLGGIGFASAFLLITVIVGIYYIVNGVYLYRYIPCAAAMLITIISGAYDDFRPMPPLYKILLQITAALCVIFAGYDLDRLLYSGAGFLSSLGFFAYPITLLWIVGITNAFNLIDGVDGLAGGVSAIIAIFLGLIIFSFSGASKAFLLCVCLTGVCLGFLILNAPLPRAKIFMGDCGSQFLGFTLALIPLMKEADSPSFLPVFYLAALFVIPIFDTTAAVWRRLRDRKKIYDPDKSHLHHKLINLGLSSKGVDAVIYTLQIIIGTLTFFAILTREDTLKSLLILGSVYVISLAFFSTIHFMNRAANRKNSV